MGVSAKGFLIRRVHNGHRPGHTGKDHGESAVRAPDPSVGHGSPVVGLAVPSGSRVPTWQLARDINQEPVPDPACSTIAKVRNPSPIHHKELAGDESTC